MSRLRVWIVMADTEYEGSDLVSVHATLASAEKECERLTASSDRAEARAARWYNDETGKVPEPKWPKGTPRGCTFSVHDSSGYVVRS